LHALSDANIQTPFIESANRRYRAEGLNQHWFTCIFEAREIIEDWRIDYKRERPHSSPRYQTPEAFRRRGPLRQDAMGEAA
jgi:putative transposase